MNVNRMVVKVNIFHTKIQPKKTATENTSKDTAEYYHNYMTLYIYRYSQRKKAREHTIIASHKKGHTQHPENKIQIKQPET